MTHKAHTTPTPACRVCGERLRADLQPGFGVFADFYMFTCDNRACAMHGFTIGERDYPTINLNTYVTRRTVTA